MTDQFMNPKMYSKTNHCRSWQSECAGFWLRLISKALFLLQSVPFSENKAGDYQRCNDAEDTQDHAHVALPFFLLTELSFVTRQTLAASDFTLRDAVPATLAALQITGCRFFNWVLLNIGGRRVGRWWQRIQRVAISGFSSKWGSIWSWT